MLKLPRPIQIAIIAAVYFVAAKVGLRFATVAVQVSVVWPPTGISLAAILLLGFRIWPGVAIGAFLANVTTEEPAWVACAIAAGNTLEAVAGAYMLRRLGFRGTLDGLREVVLLIGVAAMVSTTVSASIGATSLCISELAHWEEYGLLWSAWWLGDAKADLVVAPLILVWFGAGRTTRLRNQPPGRFAEGALLLAGVAVMCEIAFSGKPEGLPEGHPLKYTLFPFMIWAALRFAQPGVTLATFVASCFAVRGAVLEWGILHLTVVGQSLVMLQIFMGVVAGTGLFLAASTSARAKAEQHRSTVYEVTRVLSGSPSLAEAAPRILEAISKRLRWEVGALWIVDRASDCLRCVSFWHSAGVVVPAFEAATRESAFPRGIGLPGRIWSSSTPAWVRNVLDDPNFPRLPIAREEGLRGACGFPIHLGDEILGVVEFFSRSILEPEEDLLRLMSSLGGQIGLFIEQREAVESLRRGHEILRAVTEANDGAVFVKDVAGRYVMINSAGAGLLGRSVEEVLGKDAVALLAPDAAREVMERDRRVLAAGTPETREESVQDAQGIHRTYLTTLAPHLSRDGKPLGLIGISLDITGHKQAEDALKQADKRKNEFLAMLAHELRNPLAPLRHAVEMQRSLDSADPNLVWSRSLIDRQVEHLTRLVDDLLDVSRIMRNRVKLHREPIDVAVVVERAIETAHPLTEERKQRLMVSVPAAPLWVEGDRIRLAQVIGNLLNNASKFTQEGGEIDLTVGKEQNEIVITVSDNGIGIPPAMLSQVFELFTQEDRSLDRTRGGLGIGLTVVRSLVDLHGGTVTAASDGLDRGSKFVVRLPALTPVPAPKSAARPPSRSSCPPRRILVVDDNADSAESLARLLQRAGHTLSVAQDGPQALEMALSQRPEIVLLDIGLPGMDGYEVARRLREQPGGGGILLIALTGYGREEDRRSSREAGFDHHLVKPVDLEALYQLVATVGTVTR